MKPFENVTSTLCPLDIPNVDTDQIIPKQFLKRVERTGFGQFLFFDWRFTADGKENSNFTLNQHKGAAILLTRDNFGCGSSREHAPWSLLDYGFKVIIAPSYADIFYNNCFQNGILPIELSSVDVDKLFAAVAENAQLKFEIDIENQEIGSENLSLRFDIDVGKKEKLLKGLDDISWSLQFDKEITAYEQAAVVY